MVKNRYNPDIHHRRSIRLKGHNYADGGLYFVTLCADKRQELFGHMKATGQVAEEYWKMPINSGGPTSPRAACLTIWCRMQM
ncbi:hypothetical protein PDESU_02561 [Pontiella desulfatans]|uniref:Uncharacterized protein n=1 Tax=Pontiella desulfatans TaxID=2750659 RepID=A0A6C2U2Z4_PONDE|nr:hypothetical protein [Pontiella desulfatans]VGO14004.1 hypothetical protein PDESU_02561 [Pontiella desulfatans]